MRETNNWLAAFLALAGLGYEITLEGATSHMIAGAPSLPEPPLRLIVEWELNL